MRYAIRFGALAFAAAAEDVHNYGLHLGGKLVAELVAGGLVMFALTFIGGPKKEAHERKGVTPGVNYSPRRAARAAKVDCPQCEGRKPRRCRNWRGPCNGTGSIPASIAHRYEPEPDYV